MPTEESAGSTTLASSYPVVATYWESFSTSAMDRSSELTAQTLSRLGIGWIGQDGTRNLRSSSTPPAMTSRRRSGASSSDAPRPFPQKRNLRRHFPAEEESQRRHK